MIKHVRNYLVKVWCTSMVVSPLLFMILMINSIKNHHNPILEATLIVFVTMIAGILYLSPSLILAVIVSQRIVNNDMKPLMIRIASSMCLLLLISVQLLFIYSINLSPVYRGTGVMILCYLSVLMLASRFYKLTPAYSESSN